MTETMLDVSVAKTSHSVLPALSLPYGGTRSIATEGPVFPPGSHLHRAFLLLTGGWMGMVCFKFAPGAQALSDTWPGLDRSLVSAAAAAFRQTRKGNHPLSP